MPTKTWIEVPIDQEVEGVPTEGYDPFYFPPEGAKLLFEFTEDSFLKVLSALINGAALTYPNEWLQVVWYFLKNVEYPVSLCDEIAAAILTCEDVQLAIATLIATNEPVQDAISNLVTTSPTINQYITNIAMQEALGAAERGRNLLKPGQCDPDFIFNQVSVMVQLLHDLTEDLFEAIEVGTNALERASIITSSIPVFGQVIPADELLQLADQLIEEVMEDYSGAYDEALYDTIRCDLFCLFKDDCAISIDQAIAFYEDKVGETFPDDPWQALQAIIGYLNVGDFGTDTPVYAMHLLVLALIRQMQTVLGVDFGILGLRITAAGDDPNNDWQLLCEECYEPPVGCVDLRDTVDRWTPLGFGTGQYISGQGLAPRTTSGVHQFIWNRTQETVSHIINEARYYFTEDVVNYRFTMGILGTVIRSSVDGVVILNEANAPTLFPANLASIGTMQVRPDAVNGVTPSGTVRMWQACFE